MTNTMFKKFINRIFYSLTLLEGIIPANNELIRGDECAQSTMRRALMNLRIVTFFIISGLAFLVWRIYPQLILLWGVLYFLTLYYAYKKTDTNIIYDYDLCCEM